MSKRAEYEENKAALKSAAFPPAPVATISVAPPETVWSILQSSYLSSKGAVGSAPMVFLDKAAAGIRDLVLRGLRSTLLSKEADASVVSIIRDTFISPLKLIDAFRGVAGDEKITAQMESNTERYFAGRSRPSEFGEYDIYMAAGWKPKGPIRINGKMVADPPEITNMLAVYVRGADGKIEILDPSQKMDSPKGMGKLFSALWDTPKDDVDKRWQETAGTFVKWQLAPLIPSMLAGGISLAGKVPGISSKASMATNLMGKASSSSLVMGAGGIGLLSNTGDAYDLGKGLFSGALSRMEMDKLAKGLTDILTTSRLMSPQDLRDTLNGALEEHSYKEGTNAKQTYIPSLKITDNPWDRFKTLLLGRVDGYEKKNTPWDKWTQKDEMILGDVQEAMRQNEKFRVASLKICEKALTGQPLDDREYFILRIKLNGEGGRNFALFGAEKSGTIKFTANEKKETVDALRQDLSRDLKTYALDNPKEAKKNYGIEPQKEEQGFSFAQALSRDQYTDPQLLKFVRTNIDEIEKKRQIEVQALQAQAMAMH